MRRVRLSPGADLDGFRHSVRGLVAEGVPPDEAVFEAGEEAGLFGAPASEEEAPTLSLPRAVADLVRLVVCHADPERYALIYRLVWRVTHGERRLLEVGSDPLVHRLERMAKGVRRDIHKMHAFLRFREAERVGERERFVAWFEPEHHILEAAAPFFRDRFSGFDWSIHTPEASAHWNGERLIVGPGGRPEDAPDVDGFEEGWATYYASTFNPARANTRAMLNEMPKKYWRNMPETSLIPSMLAAAPQRVAAMVAAQPAEPRKRPPTRALRAMTDQEPKTLEDLNRIILASEPLVPGATRAVLGEGRIGSELAFVGEQPGDQEDIEGRPFVGPAGKLLTRALDDAGIPRAEAYVTNAVKHFKFEQRGKRRIHKKPTAGEVKHYRWWLMKELDLVHPRLTIALGATAALALAGKTVSVTKVRGPMGYVGLDGKERQGFVTVHPSFLLRLPDEAAKRREYDAFVADLHAAHELARDLAA
ncbi:UdgX family uracil-DNA binding protein [Lutibaculum baratangense]|uniref:Type-4 uracil-DNA glycosylase n=1 Tax=Lutibaculum baratangense AMV1 TaxID=631454 RepID=V4QWA5_9HYPH|nr:UdgX family uracil-DNA binding protein [Lutibaculum baratangense]ESR24017.1 Domain often clustered or fused with uracil-DNA glycosylase [Lutibaculum baratangense AMV1]